MKVNLLPVPKSCANLGYNVIIKLWPGLHNDVKLDLLYVKAKIKDPILRGFQKNNFTLKTLQLYKHTHSQQ